MRIRRGRHDSYVHTVSNKNSESRKVVRPVSDIFGDCPRLWVPISASHLGATAGTRITPLQAGNIQAFFTLDCGPPCFISQTIWDRSTRRVAIDPRAGGQFRPTNYTPLRSNTIPALLPGPRTTWRHHGASTAGDSAGRRVRTPPSPNRFPHCGADPGHAFWTNPDTFLKAALSCRLPVTQAPEPAGFAGSPLNLLSRFTDCRSSSPRVSGESPLWSRAPYGRDP